MLAFGGWGTLRSGLMRGRLGDWGSHDSVSVLFLVLDGDYMDSTCSCRYASAKADLFVALINRLPPLHSS